MDDESSQRMRMAAFVVFGIAVIAALGWYFYDPASDDAPESRPAAAEPIAETREEGPQFPLPEAPDARQRPDNVTPLPPLDDSDRYFELELANLLGSGIAELLVDRSLIENFVATIDNLPRDTVAERIRPVGRLADPFLVDGQDDSGVYTVNPASYDRYDLFVAMLSRANRDDVMDVYRRFYPLFQQAYENLGYPDGYFNDRLVEVIDHLLATPEVEPPVRLVRPHVLYEYEDPALESLSAGQKLLIRMGPDHAVAVKQFLEDMRDRITSAAPPAR
ncbi:MAG: DUF3014 domain-containing protein [Woeseiaceae bacterium]|nr:DUF3014 domain-containing protein [Woeseiaceae bacterium]